MKDLIEALTIFAKYTNTKWPTNCNHDELRVCGVPLEKVSKADRKRLEELSFSHDEDIEDTWVSYRFGSC